jgi:hypothetical protein
MMTRKLFTALFPSFLKSNSVVMPDTPRLFTEMGMPDRLYKALEYLQTASISYAGITSNLVTGLLTIVAVLSSSIFFCIRRCWECGGLSQVVSARRAGSA